MSVVAILALSLHDHRWVGAFLIDGALQPAQTRRLLGLTLAAANRIIGKALKRNLRMVFGHPPIERIVQKEGRQQG